MNKHYKYFKIGIVLAFIAIFIYLIVSIDIFNQNSVMDLISKGSGNKAFEIFFIVLASFFLVFFVPLSWLSLAVTIFFGLRGGLFITIAGLISGGISFGIARVFKDDVSRIVERMYYKKERKLSLDEIYLNISRYGFGYVVFLRSVPFVPFSIANYIFGLSFVSFKKFIVASLITISIGQSINVYFFYKAMRIGEEPLDTLIAAAIKALYFLLIFIWSRVSKYNGKK